MSDKISVALYRGYTHGEFAILQTSPIARYIGDWCRRNLAIHEYIKEGKRWNPALHRLEFVRAHWELTKMFCAYDKRLQHLFVPISFCDIIKHELETFGAEVKELSLSDYPLRKLDENIKIRPEFTDRPWQVELIRKCSERIPGMKGLSMQTGKGKTFSATRSALNLGYATCIIAPNSLPNQWFRDLFEKTTATVDDVYKIEGFDSLAKLAKCPQFKPSIFVCSTRTMQIFSKGANDYDLLPWSYSEFFKFYGIGTKIIDEAHLNFHANTMMDLQTNVPYNLYCTATFDQTNREARTIFNRIYPPQIRYGMEKYDKYVSVHVFAYSGEVNEQRCVKAKGYMHSAYEGELLKSKQKFAAHVDTVIVPVINQLFINVRKPEHKGIVFCSSIEFIKALVQALRTHYPNLKINEYIGESDDDVLKSSDLIVATSGKAGTGLDVKNLTFAYNTVSLKTPLLNAQLLGRLRKMNGVDLAYADRYDINLAAQCRHAEVRRQELKSMAAKYYEYNSMYELTYSYTAEPEQ